MTFVSDPGLPSSKVRDLCSWHSKRRLIDAQIHEMNHSFEKRSSNPELVDIICMKIFVIMTDTYSNWLTLTAV